MGTMRRLATPGLAATVVDVARVALAVVLVVLVLATLVTTGHVLAGPVPAVGPQPGY